MINKNTLHYFTAFAFSNTAKMTYVFSFLFQQIGSGALSQLAYNHIKVIDEFKFICQLENERLKGVANVQEKFS